MDEFDVRARLIADALRHLAPGTVFSVRKAVLRSWCDTDGMAWLCTPEMQDDGWVEMPEGTFIPVSVEIA